MRAPCPLGQWTGTPGHCQWCNKTIPPGRRRTWCSDTCRRVWERNHVWRRARIYARKRAKYHCSMPDCAAGRGDVEIDHITAMAGRPHTAIGCWHHQDPWIGGAEDGISLGGGLRALCTAHHKERTAQQASDRAAARRAARNESPSA